jgi:hypothetical protein
MDQAAKRPLHLVGRGRGRPCNGGRGSPERHEYGQRDGAEAAPPGSVTYVSLAIGGLNFVQFIVPVPAMLLITSEYATRSITSSLQAVPARTRLLLGKAGIVAAFGFGLGTLLGVVGVAVGVPALGGYGDFSAGDTVRSVLAIGLYCGMISMVALGIGTFTRSSAATVSILFLVLLVASTLLGGLGEALGWDWLVTISTFTSRTSPARRSSPVLTSPTARSLDC